jgi:hypothetical protein
MAHIHSIAKARLDSVSSDKLLKLKDGLYRQLKEREWILNRTEKIWSSSFIGMELMAWL